MAEQNGIDKNVPSIRRTSEGGTTKLLFKPKRVGRQSRGTAVDQDTTAGRYGWCGFEPQWLQYFHNSRWLLAVLFFQMSAVYMQNGVFFAVANSLERQFHFSNTQIGLIYAAGDIGAVILPLVVAHFAQNGHKGRWIALGLMFYALTNALLTLLQFTSEIGANDALSNATQSGIDVQYCNTSLAKGAECSKEASSTSSSWGNTAIYVFLLLRGFQSISTGTSPLMVNYIDETVAQKNVALYITILTGAPQLFLVVGIMLGAAILNIHADFYRIDTSHLETNNPQWYGAWWIAFLIVSAQIFLSLPPLLGFAKELPEKRKNRMHDVDQSHSHAGAERLLIAENTLLSKSEGFGLQHLWRITRSLLRNPVFILVVLRNSVQFSLLTGITMFLSIYLQHAFSISQTKAPLITAVCWIFPFVFGGFIGSIIIKRKRLHVKHILVMCLISNLIAYSCFMVYLNHCSEPNIAGLPRMKQRDPSQFIAEVNLKQNDRYSGFLTENCNTGCNCDLRKPYPICWNNVTYFSPCHAGCSDNVGFEVKDSLVFNVSSNQCSCISNEIYSNRSFATFTEDLDHTIAKGKCSPNEDCRFRQIIFCVFIAIGSLIGGLGGSTTLQALLHSIPLRHRTVAMGYTSCILKVFQICGPILAGALFDRSCLIWTESCTKKGSCFHYNVNQLSVTIAVVFIVGGIISTLSLFLAILLYRPADQITNNADHH